MTESVSNRSMPHDFLAAVTGPSVGSILAGRMEPTCTFSHLLQDIRMAGWISTPTEYHFGTHIFRRSVWPWMKRSLPYILVTGSTAAFISSCVETIAMDLGDKNPVDYILDSTLIGGWHAAASYFGASFGGTVLTLRDRNTAFFVVGFFVAIAIYVTPMWWDRADWRFR